MPEIETRRFVSKYESYVYVAPIKKTVAASARYAAIYELRVLFVDAGTKITSSMMTLNYASATEAKNARTAFKGAKNSVLFSLMTHFDTVRSMVLQLSQKDAEIQSLGPEG